MATLHYVHMMHNFPEDTWPQERTHYYADREKLRQDFLTDFYGSDFSSVTVKVDGNLTVHCTVEGHEFEDDVDFLTVDSSTLGQLHSVSPGVFITVAGNEEWIEKMA